MRRNEHGFTIIETIVALAIMALIGGAASMTAFQVTNSAEFNKSHMTAVSQAQNAGYWISRDAYMAEITTTDNLSPPDFILLSWTERDYVSDDIYHSITYFFEELSGGIGKLKRNHWSSAGTSNEILVAEYIYYNPDDPDNTSKASYQAPVLTLQLTTLYGDTSETREYRINSRPDFSN